MGLNPQGAHQKKGAEEFLYLLLHFKHVVMRKRFVNCRVYSCSPSKGVVFLDTLLLKDIVNRGIHAIRCASTCAYKAHRGLLLGDLCAEAHHYLWALKIWKITLKEIHQKDYDDWIDVWFNTKYVGLQDVISEGNCEIIGRRIDDLECRLGLSDAKGQDSWAYRAGEGWYNDFRYEKYDYDWEALRDEFIRMRNEAIEQQDRERIFCEGQSELVPKTQDFFDYWNDYNSVLQEDLHYKIDDWD